MVPCTWARSRRCLTSPSACDVHGTAGASAWLVASVSAIRPSRTRSEPIQWKSTTIRADSASVFAPSILAISAIRPIFDTVSRLERFTGLSVQRPWLCTGRWSTYQQPFWNHTGRFALSKMSYWKNLSQKSPFKEAFLHKRERSYLVSMSFFT